MAILTWQQTVKALSEKSISLSQKDLASLITYARKEGIGKEITFQKTEYTQEQLKKLGTFINWWDYLNTNSASEWRDKATAIKIQRIVAKSLIENRTIEIYAVFCPSYKKGEKAFGYTGVTGEHTKEIVKLMAEFVSRSKDFGLNVHATAYFSDLLLESYDRLLGTDYKSDLNNNFDDFREKFDISSSKEIDVKLLSSVPEIALKVGEKGVDTGEITVPAEVIDRIYKRNLVFYETVLGWNNEQVKFRTDILARSYSLMGNVFREMYPNGIMFWTESAYERGVMYSGMNLADPLPIIYPNK